MANQSDLAALTWMCVHSLAVNKQHEARINVLEPNSANFVQGDPRRVKNSLQFAGDILLLLHDVLAQKFFSSSFQSLNSTSSEQKIKKWRILID